MIEFKTDDFNTDHIFDCGQCFRWEREEDGSYTGIASGRIANVSYEENSVKILGAEKEFEDEAFWYNYFDLGRDYKAIKEELANKDETVGKAASYGHGIRILKQEPWETLVSFIISANNNIPRIKKNINDLAKGFGTFAGSYKGREYYNIPSPETLAKLEKEDLGGCKLGYRADYLVKTARMVVAEGGTPCYENLLNYQGVGPKVASCIALFSMDKVESFPIDTWVKKLMRDLYGIENKREMADFARNTFGDYAGIAQQYLFYYIREIS